MGKRPTMRGIRRNRTYTYEQLAETAHVSAPTVRRMKEAGLRVLEDSRPHLVLGSDFIEFVEKRLAREKVSLASDQLFCLRCRTAVRPYGMMADYVALTETRGRLTGFCERCEGTCNRMIASADLPRFRQVFEIGGDSGRNA